MTDINNIMKFRIKLRVYMNKEELADQLINFIEYLMFEKRRIILDSVVDILNDNFSDGTKWDMDTDTLEIYPIPIHQTRDKTSMAFINFDDIKFKHSPFFEAPIRISSLKIMAESISFMKTFGFTLSEPERELLSQTSKFDGQSIYQIRFFCSKINTGQQHLENGLSIEFPSHCNILALQNKKKGSRQVDPPDITAMIKMRGSNEIEFCYFNTSTSYVAGAFLVKRKSISQLVADIEEKIISKSKVLQELDKKQEMEGVILESQTLSLRCPLALTRIRRPVRSIHCKHLQCFDARAFLEMNEQTPTWSCPVCNIPIEEYKSLALDCYSMEILQRTPKHIEKVTVGPNGDIFYIDEHPSQDEYDSETESDTDWEEDDESQKVIELLDSNNHCSPQRKRRRIDSEIGWCFSSNIDQIATNERIPDKIKVKQEAPDEKEKLRVSPKEKHVSEGPGSRVPSDKDFIQENHTQDKFRKENNSNKELLLRLTSNISPFPLGIHSFTSRK
ncbi:hypothetical protein G6F56_000787 [Rhizopus delemar]|nr:hypothetical protein G6F56_000787 [Rhizopus delemar]